MRIVFVGGGSGGHFYPLIAIAEAIRDRDQALSQSTELFYLGPEPYNRDSLARLNITFVYCPSGKRRRYFSLLNFLDIFKTLFGVVCAIKRLYWLYPDVVMSKGGHTSVPIVIAAWLLRIPIVIHESDSVVGRANKFAARFARYIGITFPETAASLPSDKTALTGLPIRKYFFASSPQSQQLFGITDNRPIIFVTGGSGGAERINNLIIDSLDELLPKYTLIHQVGEANFKKMSDVVGSLVTDANLLQHYYIFGHMTGEQFSAAQSLAHLIVSRAGSGTIAEIALKGKPSILIPIPEEISHDQRSNAYAYARLGAATVLEEENISDGMLDAQITKILGDQALYQEMAAATQAFTHPQAAYTLADTLLDIGREHY